MNNNKLIIAAAGSGKTTYLVDQACKKTSEPVLITTYTEANELEIKKKIIKKKGYIPSNITIQTWFSFLLQHGVRPYQSVINDSMHDEVVGFYLTNEKSGQKFDNNGRPILAGKRPTYWGEIDFKRHYFTSGFKIYSDKISKFVVKCNQESGNEVINRIARMFDHIFIDEVQDLAGYDLEIIKLFFQSRPAVLLVGDPRQVTYLTHHSTKYSKYSDGKIRDFVENELGKTIQCEVDETMLNVSHRNNQMICHYSGKLYPSLPNPMACRCQRCRTDTTNHEGAFLVKPCDVEEYLSTYNPVQLRWSSSTKCNQNFPVMNFGESKGLSFERVLIYPTKSMANWIRDNRSELASESRAKLYVGVTRPRRSTAIVLDHSDEEFFDGLDKYSG